ILHGGGQVKTSLVIGRILIPPPKARGNGPRLCAEHQPQRHGEATRFGIIQRLCASALAAAGPSDTAAVRWWFQYAPLQHEAAERARLFRRLYYTPNSNSNSNCDMNAALRGNG